MRFDRSTGCLHHVEAWHRDLALGSFDHHQGWTKLPLVFVSITSDNIKSSAPSNHHVIILAMPTGSLTPQSHNVKSQRSSKGFVQTCALRCNTGIIASHHRHVRSKHGSLYLSRLPPTDERITHEPPHKTIRLLPSVTRPTLDNLCNSHARSLSCPLSCVTPGQPKIGMRGWDQGMRGSRGHATAPACGARKRASLLQSCFLSSNRGGAHVGARPSPAAHQKMVIIPWQKVKRTGYPAEQGIPLISHRRLLPTADAPRSLPAHTSKRGVENGYLLRHRPKLCGSGWVSRWALRGCVLCGRAGVRGRDAPGGMPGHLYDTNSQRKRDTEWY